MLSLVAARRSHLFQLLHVVVDAVQLLWNVDFLRTMVCALVAADAVASLT